LWPASGDKSDPLLTHTSFMLMTCPSSCPVADGELGSQINPLSATDWALAPEKVAHSHEDELDNGSRTPAVQLRKRDDDVTAGRKKIAVVQKAFVKAPSMGLF
jgi:hypothetical protein